MLNKAVEQIEEQHRDRIQRETDAFRRFMDAVPAEHRDNKEIRAMALVVAASQSSPVHPRQKERLQARYREIIGL